MIHTSQTNLPPKRLSAEAIEEYKQIYYRQFGSMLEDAEAEQQALRVLRLFRIILRPF